MAAAAASIAVATAQVPGDGPSGHVTAPAAASSGGQTTAKAVAAAAASENGLTAAASLDEVHLQWAQQVEEENRASIICIN
uniref:Uncharacterized protein n=1 Tax=Oryza brachyantha TaxID=4533 RepID=J3N130_ORYBR